ncbi:hypothetical protein SAMN02745824_3395 [Parasphingorhabdus marina DSM 22363]|uniref:Uncharacterized protein n=1 Tax=Parasphingorhabdus marina DSM 22363 TaxID=1123272 RepID=A0A1N6HPM2_9SPHN|nr:hypothetical protein [Parasphingorhabdus marina]SIO21711.1 hypothetical protein SAMN02745824_3395 [Parasphingorhabdus marina DSM 22363]
MDALNFHFQGGLADSNRMDFYEAARFQYAAARLSVKLDQFRKTGRFSKRVTAASRTNIDLFPFEKGSFNLNVAASTSEDDEAKIDVPLTALWTYIIERVFQPIETSAALDLIDDNALRSEFFELVDHNIFDSNEAIEVLRSRFETDRGLEPSENELLDRLISEVERRSYLKSHRDLLAQITPDQDAALVTMATPLLSELAVPLRRSAKLVTISTIDGLGKRPILTANQETASALESIRIDKEVTSIDVNIVQYNKETGWGKFRNVYWEGIPSFSVPADRKDDLKFDLLSAMQEDKVSVDAYIVRSTSGEPLRLIVVDVSTIDEIDDLL